MRAIEILRTESAYKDFSEEQLDAVATQELIAEKSTDAWTAFQNGVGGSTEALNTIKSAFANFKDDTVEGLGAALSSLFDKLDFGGITSGLDNLSSWMLQNQGQIEQFFLNLIITSIDTGDALLAMGEYGLRAVAELVPAFGSLLDWSTRLGSSLKVAAGGFLTATGQGAAGIALMTEGSRELVESLGNENRFRQMADQVKVWADAGADGIANMRSEGERLKQTFVDADFVVSLKAEIERGGFDEVRNEVNSLTKRQAIDLQARLDPNSKSQAERDLAGLVEERIAELKAEAKTAKAAQTLESLRAMERNATITAVPRTESAARELTLVAKGRKSDVIQEAFTSDAESKLIVHRPHEDVVFEHCAGGWECFGWERVRSRVCECGPMTFLVNNVTGQQFDVDVLAAYPDEAQTQSIEFPLLGSNTSVWALNPMKFIGGRIDVLIQEHAAEPGWRSRIC